MAHDVRATPGPESAIRHGFDFGVALLRVVFALLGRVVVFLRGLGGRIGLLPRRLVAGVLLAVRLRRGFG
jgi:hypothetical protein